MKLFLTFCLALLLPCLSDGADLPENLIAKLDHQFDKYQEGRAFLVDRVVNQDILVNRSEWEDFLSPDDEALVMTEEDMEALTAYHAAVIEEAAEKARSESIISIDEFRTNQSQVKEFCLDFPRAALLHIHPSGSVKQDTAIEALETINPVINTTQLIEIGTGDLTMLYDFELEYLESLPNDLRYLDHTPEDQEKLANFLFMPLEPCCHDFPRFEALFQIHLEYFAQSEENATYFNDLTYRDFFERNKAFGIDYVEFTEPMIPPNIGSLQSYNDYLEQQKELHDVPYVNYNMAFIRVFDAETNANFANEFITALQNNASVIPTVVGIDILAEETGNPALEKAQGIYVRIYNAWMNEGTIDLGGMTMHAGEIGEYAPHNVRDGIIMGVTRIGHGVEVIENPIFLEYTRRAQVSMVNNIASNWQLNVIDDDILSNHPFLDLLRLGIPLTLSTDDEGMFHTDIVNECEIAIGNSDIQYSELKDISYTSVTASFADDETKATLLAGLDAKFEAFENSFKSSSPATATPTTPTASPTIAQQEESSPPTTPTASPTIAQQEESSPPTVPGKDPSATSKTSSVGFLMISAILLLSTALFL